MTTMTGQEIADRIRWLGNLHGMENRHTDAELLAEFDRTMRRNRPMLYKIGYPVPVSVFEETITASTATSGWPGQVLDLDGGAERVVLAVRTVRVYVDSDWKTIHEIPEEDVTQWDSSTTGSPQAWATVGMQTASSTLQLLVLPLLDQDYDFQVTYLGSPWAATATDDDILCDLFDELDMAMWSVAKLCHLRDERNDLAATAAGEASAAEARAREIARLMRNKAPVRRRPVSTFFGRERS